MFKPNLSHYSRHCLRWMSVTLSLCFVAIGNLYAGELAYLNTPQGKTRLLAAQWNDTYFQVSPYIDTQENQGFCGIASMAASLNSLPQLDRPFSADDWPYRYFTQDNLFTVQSSKVKAKPIVAASGLTLEQMQLFLNALNIKSSVSFGSALSADTLRNLLKSTLNRPDQRLIVDFSRQSLQQEGHGHFSPIAAYDAVSDSVLILDVAKFKYPPFWVNVNDLLGSIQTIDSDSGKSRGILLINAGSN